MPCLICAFQYINYDRVGPSFMSSGHHIVFLWEPAFMSTRCWFGRFFLWFLDDLGEALLELLVPAEVSGILAQHAHKPLGEKLQPDKKNTFIQSFFLLKGSSH